MKPRSAELPKQKAKGLCRWCEKPVPKGSRTWCSEACLEEYKIRAWPGHARYRVEQRDKGVCELCGLSIHKIAASINRHSWKLGNKEDARKFLSRLPGRMTRKWIHHNPEATWKGSWWPAVDPRSLWQMDHRVPVAEGGGACGLDNLRTLCIWCHKKETARLRKRLSRKKRKQQEMF